jgi:hypothetical protein
MTSASNLAIFATSVIASGANPAFNGNLSVTGNIVVSNNIAIGATFSTLGAPVNGAIIQGNVGIGTTTISAGNALAVYGGNILVAGTLLINNNASSLGGITFSDGTVQNTAASASAIMRNRIINGAMQIAQRGTSFSSPASGSYTLDRWLIYSAGASVASVAQVTGPTGYQYAAQITGAAGITQAALIQRIESYNIAHLAGKTVTLSVTLLASSAQVALWAAFYPNSTDNWISQTFIASGTFSVTTSAQTFTTQISLPSSAANGVSISFYPNNGGAFTSGTLTITGVQLEAGSVATPFERPLIGDVYNECLRYYRVVTTYIQNISGAAGNSFSFPAEIPEMRVAPTATQINPGTSTNSSTFSCGAVAANLIIWNAIPGSGYWYWINPVYGLSAEL